jgi:hypothetical protein
MTVSEGSVLLLSEVLGAWSPPRPWSVAAPCVRRIAGWSRGSGHSARSSPALDSWGDEPGSA